MVVVGDSEDSILRQALPGAGEGTALYAENCFRIGSERWEPADVHTCEYKLACKIYLLSCLSSLDDEDAYNCTPLLASLLLEQEHCGHRTVSFV